jgi:hypothetical protein
MPRQTENHRKTRQLTLPDDEYEVLRRVGGGNASQGISRLIMWWRMQQQQPPPKLSDADQETRRNPRRA